ncbi:putative cytochrome P450 [Helianthus annuus]|nr:putative cytochrome P450 [Helianthus annuus]
MAEQTNNVLGLWEVINNYNEPTMLVATTSLLILAILWYKFILSNSSNGAPPLPPGPRSFPIVGYLPFLTPNLHTQFTNMAHTYGPIFKLKLGSKLHVVINTPELAKEVVRDQDEAFSNRDQTAAILVMTYGGQDMVFSDNNANWRKLRKLSVHKMLSNVNLDRSSSVRWNEVRRAVKNVFGRIGTKVDIREITFSTETSVLIRTIWESQSDKGVTNSNIVAEIDKVASKVTAILGRMNISDFFPILGRFDLQGVVRDMEKQRNKLDQLFTTIIDDRIESNLKMSEDKTGREGKKDFLQVLLDYKDEKDATPLSMIQIKSVLLNIMIAGTETTATTVEWAMSNIMQNHNIMKRLQEELVEVVGLNNIVEEHHLPKLKYLDATIKETLRMHSIVPFLIPRSPSKDCMVGGYTIPKGCTIILNVWSIHRDPRYWDDPLNFNPERFLTNKWDYNGNNLIYFPFGSGRRLCAGVPLAEKMLMLILASLLHSFDWSIPKGEKHDLTEIYSIAIKKRKPLIAIPSQRLTDVSLYM